MNTASIIRNGDELGRYDVSSRRTSVHEDSVTALFFPKVILSSAITRAVVQGSNFVVQLRAAVVPEIDTNATWSYVWGDFMLYTTGEPELRHVILLRGADRHMNPRDVAKYVRYFKDHTM